MKIEVHRNETSQPIVYENVLNTYTKGNMYCVLVEKDGVQLVHKYPLCSLFRITEDYSNKQPTEFKIKCKMNHVNQFRNKEGKVECRDCGTVW